MHFVLCILLGYLVGTVNPSYLFGRFKGLDIRKNGSGNAGASNALIVLGKGFGVLCALLDIGKTVAVIALTRHLFPHFTLAFPLTAASCILGHIFPFYMKFKGGKGLACLGGAILAYDWHLLLVMLAVELLLVLVVNYLCIVPITASFTFVLVYGFLSGDPVGSTILLLPALVILQRHAENLRRIRNGTELHLSYLWSPEKELERLKQNTSGQCDLS